MPAERDLEAETLIRWDRTGEPAILWTADDREARRWRRLGYDVEVTGTRDGKPTGWRCRVPAGAIALLPVKAGRVVASRYLDAPTLSDRLIKAPAVPGRRKDAQISAEKRAAEPGARENAVG